MNKKHIFFLMLVISISIFPCSIEDPLEILRDGIAGKHFKVIESVIYKKEGDGFREAPPLPDDVVDIYHSVLKNDAEAVNRLLKTKEDFYISGNWKSNRTEENSGSPLFSPWIIVIGFDLLDSAMLLAQNNILIQPLDISSFEYISKEMLEIINDSKIPIGHLYTTEFDHDGNVRTYSAMSLVLTKKRMDIVELMLEYGMFDREIVFLTRNSEWKSESVRLLSPDIYPILGEYGFDKVISLTYEYFTSRETELEKNFLNNVHRSSAETSEVLFTLIKGDKYKILFDGYFLKGNWKYIITSKDRKGWLKVD